MKGFEAATTKYLTSLAEAELQAQIIEPLLRLQGFTHVYDTSGPNDNGKDLVAVKVEFGKTKLYGIQIKKLRFSGKHSQSNALTAVLTQLRQIFGEPVLDPTVNEKRFVDRCIFITPFPISRTAFESALCQLKESERGEISVVDGPLLADLVLKNMPEVIAQSSVDFGYRNRIAGECNQVKEFAAFGGSRTLELDNIYVELSLNPSDVGIEDIAFGNMLLKNGQIVAAADRDLKELEQQWLKWTEGPFPSIQEPEKTEVNKGRIESLTRTIQDRLNETAAALEHCRREGDGTPQRGRLLAERSRLKSTRVVWLNLVPLLHAIKEKAAEFVARYSRIQSPEMTNAACTAIVRSGMKMSRDLRALKSIQLVAENWPVFWEQPRVDPVQHHRLGSSAVLKIDLPTFVTGAPGAGKTTLMRRLVQTMARHSSGQLPLLIYLVQFQNVQRCDILEVAMRELSSQGVSLTAADLKRSFEAGAYRVFFDGLDEAGNSADLVLENIERFANRYPKCPVVITTRESLQGKIWKDALHIRLAPLNDRQMGEFLKNWFTSEPSKIVSLLKWLEENARMREAARTPIVAALLCSLIHVDADMPTTEVDLYDQRFQLLLGKWERAKGIQPLSQDLRRSYWHFLMNLATELHTSGARSAPKEKAVDVARDFYSKSFHGSPDALVADCIHRGLMEQETFGGVSFGHLTYQEFLVASWLAHHNPTPIILLRLCEPWWEKALNLYAAIKGDISALLEAGMSQPTSLEKIERVKVMSTFAPLTHAALITKYEVRARSAFLLGSDATDKATRRL